MRRFLLSASASLAAVLMGTVSAGAWCEFCDWDPVVLIVTPAGNLVPVYDSVWTSSPLQVGLPLESYQATRAYDHNGNPVTDVDVSIYVPTGLLTQFRTLDEVTTGILGTGTVLGATQGSSGTTTHVRFRLNQP